MSTNILIPVPSYTPPAYDLGMFQPPAFTPPPLSLVDTDLLKQMPAADVAAYLQSVGYTVTPGTPVTPPVVTPPAGTAGFGQAPMQVPAGYTAAQKVWGDTFAGTALDLSKWSPEQGANGILWNNGGRMKDDPFGFPYTGPNTNSAGASLSADSELYVPWRADNSGPIKVNNGLSITASPNTPKGLFGQLDPLGIHYGYQSGCICSTAKPGHGPGETAHFSLPQTGKTMWRINAKMCDMNHGLAPCAWLMPATGSGKELDFIQGCFTRGGGNQNSKPLAMGFAPSAQVPILPFDSTAAFHEYGIELDWKNNLVNFYVDGKPIGTPISGQLSPCAYELMLNVQAWITAPGWATVVDNMSSGTFQIAETDVYAA